MIIQPIKMMPAQHRQSILSKPYPIQTVSENQIRKIFVHQKRQYIQDALRATQARHILNPGWEEFDCKYRCM
jgi:hypothetical protein